MENGDMVRFEVVPKTPNLSCTSIAIPVRRQFRWYRRSSQHVSDHIDS